MTFSANLSKGMLYNGTDNLRCYVREAVLPMMINGSAAPAMPPDGHKSHLNTLAIRAELYRKLESIYGLNTVKLDTNITSWIDTHIPETSLGVPDGDEATGERLSIPSAPIFNIPPHWQLLPRPSDVNRMSQWLDILPLQTVQRVLHLVHPQTQHWSFSLDDDKDIDDSIFRSFFWSLPHPVDLPGLTINQHSVVVAFQAPWVLSPQDLQRFAECRSFPPFRLHGSSSPIILQSKERLWGKLWDLCVRKKCPWFAVSTYTGWVFGAFSKGWTKAFVSSVYDFDACSPTIVECLLYWIVSAMGLPEGWKIPEVPEPVDNLAPDFSIPPPHDDRFVSTPSESSWDGKSDETGSSAGISGVLSPRLSDAGLPGRLIPLHMPTSKARFDKVLSWIRTGIPSSTLPPDNIPPSPAMSDWSSSSTSTVKDFAEDGKYCGDWLVTSPGF